jgi:hypothetical protein
MFVETLLQIHSKWIRLSDNDIFLLGKLYQKIRKIIWWGSVSILARMTDWYGRRVDGMLLKWTDIIEPVPYGLD